jgi:hypothetical protein
LRREESEMVLHVLNQQMSENDGNFVKKLWEAYRNHKETLNWYKCRILRGEHDKSILTEPHFENHYCAVRPL